MIKIEEEQHILNILVKSKEALEKRDYIRIKNLSNNVIHHASIHQDPNVVSVAVIIYALSKLIERESYKKEKNWLKFYKNYCQNINDMIMALKNKDIEAFNYEVSSNRRLVEEVSGKLKVYINDVFRRAQINKASRIYEHGISMEKTAKILGISLWELLEYAGKTGIGDVNLGVTMSIEKRINIAENFFE